MADDLHARGSSAPRIRKRGGRWPSGRTAKDKIIADHRNMSETTSYDPISYEFVAGPPTGVSFRGAAGAGLLL